MKWKYLLKKKIYEDYREDISHNVWFAVGFLALGLVEALLGLIFQSAELLILGSALTIIVFVFFTFAILAAQNKAILRELRK